MKERSKDVEYLMKLSHELVEYNAAQQASTRKIHHIISTYHALCKQIKVPLINILYHYQNRSQYIYSQFLAVIFLADIKFSLSVV